MMAPIIEQNLFKIQAICRRYGVQKMFLFGSAATGADFTKKSDVDFLYKLRPEIQELDFEERPDFFEMLFSFEDLLGGKVDLIDLTLVRNPYFIQSVNQNKLKIYEA